MVHPRQPFGGGGGDPLFVKTLTNALGAKFAAIGKTQNLVEFAKDQVAQEAATGEISESREET